MNITKVKVYPYKRRSRTGACGVGMIIFDCGLMLTGLELIEHGDKRFIGYPKNPYNLKGHAYVEPLSYELKSLIRNSLFDAYDKMNIDSNKEDNSFMQAAIENMFSVIEQQTKETKATHDLKQKIENDIKLKEFVNKVKEPSTTEDTSDNTLNLMNEQAL